MLSVNHEYYKMGITYISTLYMFFLMVHQIYALFELRLEKILADQRLVEAQASKVRLHLKRC